MAADEVDEPLQPDFSPPVAVRWLCWTRLAEEHHQVPIPQPVSPYFCGVPVVLTASGPAGSPQALL